MNYESKLKKLEHLKKLVEQYIPIMYRGGDDIDRIYNEICETYGEVADVFEELLGRQSIAVPTGGDGDPDSIYPNYFEAGFSPGDLSTLMKGRQNS